VRQQFEVAPVARSRRLLLLFRLRAVLGLEALRRLSQEVNDLAVYAAVLVLGHHAKRLI
jgi:hypothetical protein